RNSASVSFSLSTTIVPLRLTVIDRPSFDSRGLLWAFGSVMSTPPSIIGAVIMKITSSSIMTSIRLTTFTSAISANVCRRARRAISDPAFAHEQRDDRGAEALEHPVELIETACEDVVPERGRDGDDERRRRGGERLAYAGGNRGEIA